VAEHGPVPASSRKHSAGLRQPSVSRGRPFSSAATASSSACVRPAPS